MIIFIENLLNHLLKEILIYGLLIAKADKYLNWTLKLAIYYQQKQIKTQSTATQIMENKKEMFK